MSKIFKTLITFLMLITNIFSAYPVVIFHGINDRCTSGDNIDITSYLSSRLSTEVKCVEIGDGNLTSMLSPINSQGKEACEKIAADPMFAGKEISVLGVSQGGLIARYIVQKCEFGGIVKRYGTLSTPQMGVVGVKFPTCGTICMLIDWLLSDVAYFEIAQSIVAPSNYFKDRYNYDTYLKYSSYLADINNERPVKNPSYKAKITSLEKMLLVVNEVDDVVDPPTSGWFDFYAVNSDTIVPRRESDFFKQDYLGIRELEESGRITFARFKGTHVKYTHEELENYFVPLLR